MMGNIAHYEDFAFIVDRVCFNEHDAESGGARVVQIYHACLSGPFEGAVSRSSARAANYLL
jgi:hypothetical protein